MRKTFNLIVLLAITAGALYYTLDVLKRDREASDGVIPAAGEALLPTLFDRINDVARVDATSGGQTYALAQADGRWTMPSKFDYPADATQVRQLLIGLAGLERVEPKTANPELYARLGLADPTSEDSDAVRYVATDASGTTLFDVVLGNRKFAPGDSSRSDVYVRVGDDAQTWLVTGKLPEATDASQWLDDRLGDIARARVASFVVTHADDETVTAVRDSNEVTDFRYSELPEGAELDQQWRINDIARSLDGLAFDDVQPASETIDGAEPAYTAVMRTFDGLQVDISAQKVEKTVYVTLAASTFEPQESGEDMDSAEGAEAKDRPDAAADAARLNARWSGWRYQLPNYKAGHLSNRAKDLVKAPEPASASDLGLPQVFDLKNPAAEQTQ